MRPLKFLFILLGVLLLLAVLGLGLVRWQGERQWEAVQKALRAQGEKLTLAEMEQLPVAEEENFFGDPMWREIVETRVQTPEGGAVWVPAVSQGHQVVETLNYPIPPEEAAALKQAWPRFAKEDLAKARKGMLMGLLVRYKQSDTAWRKDWAGFTLEALKPVEPFLDRVAARLDKPEARFPVSYSGGMTMLQPHLTKVTGLGQGFMIRAQAEIELGYGEAASRDVTTLVKLSHVVQGDWPLISYLVRLSVLAMAVQEIEQGVNARVWNDRELSALEALLAKEDLAAGLAHALRGERGGFNDLMERFRRGGYGEYLRMAEQMRQIAGQDHAPTWADRTEDAAMKMYIGEVLRYDQASHNLVIQRMVDHLGAKGWLALNTGVVFPSAEYAGGGLFSAHRLGKMMWLPLLNVFQRSAYVQDQVIQARIALALERCFLAKREYPEKLEALTPDYLTQVPKEALTGRSMHYVRNAPNQYLLWADGWDGKDDHARPSERGKIGEGDWVWGKY